MAEKGGTYKEKCWKTVFVKEREIHWSARDKSDVFQLRF